MKYSKDYLKKLTLFNRAWNWSVDFERIVGNYVNNSNDNDEDLENEINREVHVFLKDLKIYIYHIYLKNANNEKIPFDKDKNFIIIDINNIYEPSVYEKNDFFEYKGDGYLYNKNISEKIETYLIENWFTNLYSYDYLIRFYSN